jgi:hypothetical protein
VLCRTRVDKTPEAFPDISCLSIVAEEQGIDIKGPGADDERRERVEQRRMECDVVQQRMGDLNAALRQHWGNIPLAGEPTLTQVSLPEFASRTIKW